jgi:Pentapeptide repeats (9 copies)
MSCCEGLNPRYHRPMSCACESIHPFPCQFPGETEFFRITPEDDREWCRFHLPLRDAGGNESNKQRGETGWEEGGVEWRKFAFEIHDRLHAALQTGFLEDYTRANLQGVAFPPNFDFTGAADKFHVNLNRASFGDEVSFDGTAFSNEASFVDAIFGVGISFLSAKFGYRAHFNGAIFSDNVSFGGTTFGGYASFEGVTFGGGVNFGGATFGDGANFNRAAFCYKANFKAATFGNATRFERATFEGKADFSDASFGVGADFTQAIFKEVTDFSDTSPAPNPDTVRRDLALRFVSFRKALFNGQAIFENRAFATSSLFDGAIFENLAQFHGCKFHQGMFFHEADFRKTIGGSDTQTAELEQSYRTLKRAMADLHARNEEADFFALEMECRRQRRSVPRFERFAATLYKHLSDYGRSVARPLVWLGFLLGYGFAYFYHLAQAKSFHVPGDVLRFVLEQITTPFSIWRNEYKCDPWMVDYLKDHPLLLRGPATLMTLTAIALIALFLLALRRRFKMD